MSNKELSLTLRLNIDPALDSQLDSLLAAMAVAVTPRGGYEQGDGSEDGAQHVDLQWWSPEHGCDSLDRTLDAIRARLIAAVTEWYRSALDTPPTADEPAVPQEGREPAAVASEASAWFAVAAIAQDMRSRGLAEQAAGEELLRLANNRRSQPAVPPPAEGEAGELVEFLLTYGDHAMDEYGDLAEHDLLTRAATLLQQQATELAAWRSRAALVPVPVGERLPGAADCDALGRCWWFGPFKEEDSTTYSCWALVDCPCSGDTHWLPHWAISHPPHSGEVEG